MELPGAAVPGIQRLNSVHSAFQSLSVLLSFERTARRSLTVEGINEDHITSVRKDSGTILIERWRSG